MTILSLLIVYLGLDYPVYLFLNDIVQNVVEDALVFMAVNRAAFSVNFIKQPY